MEATLEAELEKSISQNGVSGILACDADGLCLTTKGDLTSNISGYTTALAARAATLHPGSAAPPVVCVESDEFTIVIQKNDKVTLAVKQARADST